ncbi:DUF5819 family protein [Streptomyces sp. ACA25]|nr:DUF5819 family protein [Streptomyces sp. ACA25]MDB1086364.1 DUF5819 family protein [Streptomyces sp. ACA25]
MATAPPPRPAPALGWRAASGSAVVLCLAVTLIHVFLVFLHVSPANVLSERYDRQIDAWVMPVFEQNWRLFAPDPESVNHQISARTRHTTADGTVRTSGWFDLTAVDRSAVEHQVFPSHTAQNMLRRAWTSYRDTHGGDDRAHSERAVMMRTYLRNIAADRVAAHRPGAFDAIQLRVVTVPIGAPAAAGHSSAAATRAATETRRLPWWEVAPDGRN